LGNFVEEPDHPCFVAGWGVTKADVDIGTSEVLFEATLTGQNINATDCFNRYSGDNNINMTVDEFPDTGILCTGGIFGDACKVRYVS
jgi:hypothetical protein